MRLKKLVSGMLAVMLVCSMVTGCSKSEGSEKDKGVVNPEVTTAAEEGTISENGDEKVTITIGDWPTPDSDQYEYMENLKKKMNDLYPNIEIITDEYTYSVDTFLPKAASGQLPNLYRTWFTEANKIINAGYAEDITNVLENNNVSSNVNPDLLALCEKDGHYYGLPTSAYSMSMMYNVDLFKEAGLIDENGVPVFPKTWEEVALTAVTIKEKTGKYGFFYPTKNNQGGWMFMNIAWGFGADFEKQVDGKWTAAFDSQEAADALQFIKDLKWKYNVLPDNTLVDLSDFMKLYGSDQVAMGLCHIDMVNSIVKNTGMSKDNFALSTVPAGPAGKAALMGGTLYMVAPGTTEAQQDAIMKYLELRGESPRFTEETKEGFDTQYKTRAEQNSPVGPMGVRIWTSEDRIKQENEILNKYSNVDMKLWNAYCEHSSENIKPEPPVNSQELYGLLDTIIQEVLTNKDADPKALLTKAAASFQKDYLNAAQ